MSAEAAVVATQKHEVMNCIIDEVEARILSLPNGKMRRYGEEFPEFPTFHHFTPGLYCRELHMAKGSIVTSYVHRFEHPYVVTKGECFVFSDECVWVRVAAPYFGITKAGTRRMLVMVEDTVWTTFHTTNTTDIEALEREIFIVPPNPLFEGVII